MHRINTIRMNTPPCNKVVSQTSEFKLKSNEKEHFQIQSDNRTSTKLSLKLSFKTLFLEKEKLEMNTFSYQIKAGKRSDQGLQMNE